jgi:aspartyl-tRNA(Asn)/glutamyl-tRNA(Gln) amidotransferase subunit A
VAESSPTLVQTIHPRLVETIAQLHDIGKWLPYDRPMRPVVQLADDVRSGRTGARELVAEALSHIEAGNGPLNAFIHLDAEAALAAAAAVDDDVANGRSLGPLAGVPFGVKDLDDCAGMPTGKGSRWYSGLGPVAADAIHVGRLRRAGAIPLGKTAVPEFGFWAYTSNRVTGVTRNPYDLTRTPGGSSGGSAASVAAGLVPFATASDGGGSTRTPAGFCGLVGHKPSFGRIPDRNGTRTGQTAAAGALATTVADAARLLDVMAGPDLWDRTSLPAPTRRFEHAIEDLVVDGLRVAWSLDLGFALVDPEVASCTTQAAADLVAAAHLTNVDVDVSFPDLIATWALLESVDRWVAMPPGLWPERADDLDQGVRPAFEHGATMSVRDYAAVVTRRRELEFELADLFSQIDVLLTPTSAIPAFAAEGPMPTELDGQPLPRAGAVPFAMLGNLYGLPACSVPAGFTADGLPIGLQIVGTRHADDVVLRLARIVEQTRPWPRTVADYRS